VTPVVPAPATGRAGPPPVGPPVAQALHRPGHRSRRPRHRSRPETPAFAP